MNTLEKKYKSIDLSKLPEKLRSGLKKLKEDTDNFKSKDDKLISKAESTLDKTIGRLKEVLPDAIREVKAKAETPKTKTREGKPDPDDTIKQRADKIQKKDEPKPEAEKRAKSQLKDESKDRSKKMKGMDALAKYLKNKKLKDFNPDATDVKRDAGREAKKRGKRVSKKGWKNQHGTSKGGRTYYENRENRSDHLAPKFPKGLPKLKEGGSVESIPYDVVVQYKTREPYFILNENLTKKEAENKIREFEASGKKFNLLYMEPALPFEKGGKIKTDFYVPPYEIRRVVLNNGKVISNFDDDEIMSGIYGSNTVVKKRVSDNQLALFNQGGNIPEHAVYIPNGSIDFIETDHDGNIQGQNMYNGVWMKNDKQNEVIKKAIIEGRLKGFKNKKIAVFNKKLPTGVTANIIEAQTTKGTTIYGGEISFKNRSKLLLYKFFPIGSTSQETKKAMSSYLSLLKFSKEFSRTKDKTPFYAIVIQDRGRYQTLSFNNEKDATTLKTQLQDISKKSFAQGGRTLSAFNKDKKYINSSEQHETDYAKSKLLKRPTYKTSNSKLAKMKELNEKLKEERASKKLSKGGNLKKEIIFKEYDYKKLVENAPEYPFYSTKDGDNYTIHSEKTNEKAGVFYPKKNILKYNSSLEKWLLENSYLKNQPEPKPKPEPNPEPKPEPKQKRKGNSTYVNFVKSNWKKDEETWKQAMKRCKPLYAKQK